MKKWLLCLIFFVKVTIPWGIKAEYWATQIANSDNCYRCTLENGRIVLVPIMFTVIEEIKK